MSIQGDKGRPVGPRRAKAEEAAPLAHLWLRSRYASIPAIPPPVHTADDVRAWFAEVVVATTEVWLIEEAELPVALLVLDGDWVDQLYVDPDHTGPEQPRSTEVLRASWICGGWNDERRQ
jgi:hypothetical protein